MKNIYFIIASVFLLSCENVLSEKFISSKEYDPAINYSLNSKFKDSNSVTYNITEYYYLEKTSKKSCENPLKTNEYLLKINSSGDTLSVETDVNDQISNFSNNYGYSLTNLNNGKYSIVIYDSNSNKLKIEHFDLNNFYDNVNNIYINGVEIKNPENYHVYGTRKVDQKYESFLAEVKDNTLISINKNKSLNGYPNRQTLIKQDTTILIIEQRIVEGKNNIEIFSSDLIKLNSFEAPIDNNSYNSFKTDNKITFIPNYKSDNTLYFIEYNTDNNTFDTKNVSGFNDIGTSSSLELYNFKSSSIIIQNAPSNGKGNYNFYRIEDNENLKKIMSFETKTYRIDVIENDKGEIEVFYPEYEDIDEVTTKTSIIIINENGNRIEKPLFEGVAQRISCWW